MDPAPDNQIVPDDSVPQPQDVPRPSLPVNPSSTSSFDPKGLRHIVFETTVTIAGFIFIFLGLISSLAYPKFGFVIIASGVTLIPRFWQIVKHKTNIGLPNFVKAIIFLALIIYAGSTLPETTTPNSAPSVNIPTPSPLSQEKMTEQNPAINTANASLAASDTVTVTRVIDGDTIALDNGKTLRYIGIDAPETVDPRQPVQCFGSESSAKNKELVEGKTVILEKDVSETDRYGRLLRYVYVGDTLINELLVKEGYANASSYPPDVKYQDKLRAAEEYARENKLGLWGDACAATPTPTTKAPTRTPTPKPTSTTSQSNLTSNTTSNSSSTSGFSCNCNKTCSQMASCEEAYFQLNSCGCSDRDGNSDGVPCESICP